MSIDKLTRILSIIVAAAAFTCMSTADADTLLIENVTLIDGTGRPPVAGAWVLVDNDRIRLISRD